MFFLNRLGILCKLQAIFLVFPIIISSCATTQKGKILEAMLIGSTLGAVYGGTKDSYKQQNAILFASLGGMAGTLISVASDDSDKKIKDLEVKVKFLDEASAKQNSPSFEEIPDEFRMLLETSQNYEMYKINRWTKKGHYLVNEGALIDLKEKR